MTEHDLDVVVVGGGAAGLSAGLVLGRARRRTLVVDAGEQSNRAADGIGGLLGHDRRLPGDLYTDGAAELAAYPSAELRAGRVADARAQDGGFAVTLDDGATLTTRKLLLAMGMEYRHPSIDGAAERWGGSVFFCPFCDGWEARDRPLGVYANGETGARKASLLSLWSDDVTVLTDGPADLGAGAAELAGRGIAVDERPVAALEGPGRELTAVRFRDGSQRALAGLLVPVTGHQRDGLAVRLGVAFREPDPISAEVIAVDAGYRTSVPGVSAAGDIAEVVVGGLAEAVHAGSAAASSIVIDLAGEAP